MRPTLRQRGLTLIELMVVIAVAAVLLTLAAPSFRDFILMQRLKGVNAQLVTDLQYARSEAVSRGKYLRLHFMANGSVSCYTLYATSGAIPDTAAVNAQRCQCTVGAGAACSVAASMEEVRTVQVPQSQSVSIAVPTGWPVAFAFDPVTGGLVSIPLDNPSSPLNQVLLDLSIDTARTLRTIVAGSGRPTVCAPAGSTMPEAAC